LFVITPVVNVIVFVWDEMHITVRLFQAA